MSEQANESGSPAEESQAGDPAASDAAQAESGGEQAPEPVPAEPPAEPQDEGDVISHSAEDEPKIEKGADATALHDAVSALASESGNLITFHESKPVVADENRGRLSELIDKIQEEFGKL